MSFDVVGAVGSVGLPAVGVRGDVVVSPAFGGVVAFGLLSMGGVVVDGV